MVLREEPIVFPVFLRYNQVYPEEDRNKGICRGKGWGHSKVGLWEEGEGDVKISFYEERTDS